MAHSEMVTLVNEQEVSMEVFTTTNMALESFKTCNQPFSTMWYMLFILHCKGIQGITLNEEAMEKLKAYGLLIDGVVPNDVKHIVDAGIH